MRPDNIRLALATMALALLLAMPLVGFNAISVRDQVARLKSGKVTVEKFDWAALAFDFGVAGRHALSELTRAMNPAIAARATTAMKIKNRWDLSPYGVTADTIVTSIYDVQPAGAVLPDELKVLVTHDFQACSGSAYCRVYIQPGGISAIAIGDGCMALPPAKRTDPAAKCSVLVRAFVLKGGTWVASDDLTNDGPDISPDQQRASLQQERAAIDDGRVELRDVTEKQVFIGGKPVGRPFKQP